MLDDAALAEIEARCDAATFGPWGAADEYGNLGPEASRSWCVSRKSPDGKWMYDIAYVSEDHADKDGTQEEADAEFMAHARTDVPALVAALRAERAKTQRVRDLHQQTPMYETCPAWHGCADDACMETLDGGYVHADRRDGDACSHCCESDGEPVGWPCETVAALEGGTDE